MENDSDLHAVGTRENQVSAALARVTGRCSAWGSYLIAGSFLSLHSGGLERPGAGAWL